MNTIAPSFAIKRGNTFHADCVFRDDAGQAASLAGITVSSQVRDQDGRLVASLTFAAGTGTGEFRLTAPTAAWPLATLVWDIRYVMAGEPVSTETIAFEVVREVTKP